MKTIKFILLFSIMAIGGAYSTLSAQEKIEALIDYCENYTDIGGTMMIEYLDEECTDKTIRINDNKELADRFFQAFAEERENSDRLLELIEERKKGELTTGKYYFYDGYFYVTTGFAWSDPSEIIITYKKRDNERIKCGVK